METTDPISPLTSSLPLEEQGTQKLEGYAVEETPFEEHFDLLSKTAPTEIIEEIEPETALPKPEIIRPLDLYPYVEKILDIEASVGGFVSPEMFIFKKEEIVLEGEVQEEARPLVPSFRLPPITLEEKIEGAMFAVGRPVHVSELIENLQIESPVVKRTLRKLQRGRKRTSPIVIDEISKDRWVMQLNPMYYELFSPQMPDRFMENDERKVITEIAYRQPISLAMVKKMVQGIGPVKVTEICNRLEYRGFITSEKRARSLVFTTTPSFAKAFGFDDESRRLKLQMLWRLKRLMGDYDAEEEEEEVTEEVEKEEVDEEVQEKEEEEEEEEAIEEVEKEEVDEEVQAKEEEEEEEEAIEEVEEEEVGETSREEKKILEEIPVKSEDSESTLTIEEETDSPDLKSSPVLSQVSQDKSSNTETEAEPPSE
ncbi:MAG: SMC-Scp complex subunit ScpB [Candidatus Heimdallarchaeota archaeon]